MSAPSARKLLALPVLMLALASACADQAEEKAWTSALLIDHDSLPAHRHADAIEQLKRELLRAQQPGNRLLLDARAVGVEDRPLEWIELPDRPLQSTRILRALNERFQASETNNEAGVLERLPEMAARLRAQSGQRCLYLALDADAAGLPRLPEDGWVRALEDDYRGWTAFLLISGEAPSSATRDWARQLYQLGADRVMVTSLTAPLPRCR